MTSSTATQMRAWTGPALLTYGFRPFFLGAALWALGAMLVWVAMIPGWLTLPTAFDPVSWHAHEFLFGTLGAVIAGFLLTAVPNWTGRLPIVGWPLGVLALVWLGGRVAIAVSAFLPAVAVGAIDLAFPVLLGLALGREIVAGKNWRNLVVLGMLGLFAAGNAAYHISAATGGYAAQSAGLRLGLGAAILMIGVIGGRIIPSFTRNWLAKRGPGALPAAPMQGFDKLALGALLLAVAAWTALPAHPATGVLLLIAGVLHIARLARWAGYRTLAEPLVTVLHAGYGFLALGAVALGIEALWPDTFGTAAAQHLWMAGATGLMALGVMTRATLGHTGQSLTATRGTVAVYAAFTLSVLSRVAAGAVPDLYAPLIGGAGVLWVAAYAGFAVIYGPLLLRAPPAKTARQTGV